jgi:hypothetical protein
MQVGEAISRMSQHVSQTSEKFLKRRELAARWRCSGETIKRKQRTGLLTPIRLSQRLLLYRLSEIEALERAAQ